MPLLLFGLAIAPGIAIAMYIYFRDKYEHEPLKLLISTFTFGFFSVFPAALIETMLMDTFPTSHTMVGIAVSNFIFVGFVEEGIKYFSLKRFAYNKPDFNEPFDGITYSVMISMGFATSENIMYVMEGGLSTAMIRIFSAVPAHASFGIMMGYFVGLAKFTQHRKSYLFLGIFTATIFHGAYDFFLSVNNIELIALGAVISLIIGIRLSFKAMNLLNENSPFRYSQILGIKTPENSSGGSTI
jgi:protease PrsW